MHPTYQNQRHKAEQMDIFPREKSNTPIQEMPPENVPAHVEFSIMRYVMVSSMEAELGGLFENFQKATSMRTALSEMGHPQPPKQV